jgi:hypothetical protein
MGREVATVGSSPPVQEIEPEAGKVEISAEVTLAWIPLGAGGAAIVRVSGRVYEAIRASIDGRPALDLYHTALEIRVGDAAYVVENAWPSPDDQLEQRGVVVQGPVWSPWLGRFRVFRYETRCWRDGQIADVAEAVATETVSTDSATAWRLIHLSRDIPDLTWGRRVSGSAEMWNSNSAISYLLTSGGVPARSLEPPVGGSAPGWETGCAVASANLARFPVS